MQTRHLVSAAAAVLIGGLVATAGSDHAKAAALIHHYDFNGAGVIDTVGGANGTLFGGASVSGGVLNLDGINDYVEMVGNKIVPTGTSAFTVSLDARQLSNQVGHRELISQ
ncbi:MAG: hypothetical protein QF578_06535 [Alphaproteobacteria bacterium]|jgi:hypothetical protein|nr:hypothetical protein [Alphaproteobacteria bacterium]MDP6815810.1 hypothetical protein [Alphaproteobacteria bacterium]